MSTLFHSTALHHWGGNTRALKSFVLDTQISIMMCHDVPLLLDCCWIGFRQARWSKWRLFHSHRKQKNKSSQDDGKTWDDRRKNMCVSWGKSRLHRLISHGPAGPLLLFFGAFVRYLLERLNNNAKTEERMEERQANFHGVAEKFVWQGHWSKWSCYANSHETTWYTMPTKHNHALKKFWEKDAEEDGRRTK